MDADLEATAVARFISSPDRDTFVEIVNELLGRPCSERVGSGSPADDLDSLELVVLLQFMDDIGADVPSGLESALNSIGEFHEHALRRLGHGR